MVYLKTPWLDGTDADYFKFNSLRECVDYITEEGITEFIISTELCDDKIPEFDYTWIS